MEPDENKPNKGARGPKPKQLKEKTVLGLEVGRGGNRNIVPPDQVYNLASIGCTNAEIAAFFNIKTDTLARNFASELAKGREYTKTRLRMNMFKAADNLNPAILIFLAKNILGMSDQAHNSEANQPLPWREDTDQLTEENQDDQETSNSEL